MSIKKGGLAPLGKYKDTWIFRQMKAIGKKYGFDLNTPVGDIAENAMNIILYGSDEAFELKSEFAGVISSYSLNFEGIINFISNQKEAANSRGIHRWADSFMNQVYCPVCHGQRLKQESLQFKIDGRNISEVTQMDLHELYEWLSRVPSVIEPWKQKVGAEILREIRTRISFCWKWGWTI